MTKFKIQYIYFYTQKTDLCTISKYVDVPYVCFILEVIYKLTLTLLLSKIDISYFYKICQKSFDTLGIHKK